MNAILPSVLNRPTRHSDRPLVRIVILGSVDHGKSTLIGRLLHETGSLPDGKLDHLKAVSARRGMPFEWSFLLDALQTERDQGITIDTSQIRFRTEARDFVLIDAPGHAEFLRNMITGAAQADGAVLMVDATEGVREQTRRHCYLVHLLGIRQLIVVVNKMDRLGYDPVRFCEIETEITDYLNELGLAPAAIIPASAREGVGITAHHATLATGGPTVIAALERFAPAHQPVDLDLRLPIQAVYKFDDRRILAGRIESGRLVAGDEVILMPSGKTARVSSIETWPATDGASQSQETFAGQSVGVTLDRELFVERGNVLSHATLPARTGRYLRARVFWLHREALAAGSRLAIRIGTAETRGVVLSVDRAIDPGQIAEIGSDRIGQNHVGEILLELARPLAVDLYTDNPRCGRIVLEFGGRIAGGGLILTANQDAHVAPDTTSSWPTAQFVGSQALPIQAKRLSNLLTSLSVGQRLARLRAEIDGRIAFTTSFGLEDQVLLHLVAEHDLEIDLVTLDTGRLFNETNEVWAASEQRYGRRIQVFTPRSDDVEALIRRQGVNGFYQSRDARLACCHVRKVAPLNRALAGAHAWVTGLRGDQSNYRKDMALVEADTMRGLIKVNPLFDWSREQALAFATANDVPLNALHAKGFASIGCAPCTRAIVPGESERAGRWWWEQEVKKECGLHA
ncbi:MAG: phosphoadenylyl-sulfate reductase [Xanthobacteraceae bacterium]